MNFTRLEEWLNEIKNIHWKTMDLDLLRVSEVAKKLGVGKFNCPVIIVGGTNGKGSTVAVLEAIYSNAGYRVGVFTSPYLYKFNEQIKVAGKMVTDEKLCEVFQKINDVRGDFTLTQFEFTTLAALEIFQEEKLDLIILEVGLGGRLDAVNIIDADVSIITSIGVDHADYLGDTRDAIAFEKSGIFRKDKFSVCGEFHIPQTIFDYAKKIETKLFSQNIQFGFETDGFHWNWWSETTRFENLPLSQLLLQNLSTALMAVELLQPKLKVTRDAIEKSLSTVVLPGRIQVFPGDVTKIFDVSHNPAAVTLLANYLKDHATKGKTIAVFSMLADKDILGTIWTIKDEIDDWYIAPLQTDRAASVNTMQYCFRKIDVETKDFTSVKEAYDAALTNAKPGDRVIIFGSFHTVSEVLSHS